MSTNDTHCEKLCKRSDKNSEPFGVLLSLEYPTTGKVSQPSDSRTRNSTITKFLQFFNGLLYQPKIFWYLVTVYKWVPSNTKPYSETGNLRQQCFEYGWADECCWCSTVNSLFCVYIKWIILYDPHASVYRMCVVSVRAIITLWAIHLPEAAQAQINKTHITNLPRICARTHAHTHTHTHTPHGL